jgi:NarL family two-component system response regulator LiaR
MSQEKKRIRSNQKKVNKYSVILVDDHPLMRQALRNLLEKQLDFEIVAEANDGEEAIKLASELIPDIIIMDINMPKINGLEATIRIKETHPKIIILVLTVHTDNEYISGLLEAGAGGYLVKSIYGDEIIPAIRALVAGETVLSPSISLQLVKNASRHEIRSSSFDAIDKLSTKELEILRLAAKGLSNKVIAYRLGLSLRTVKAYMVELFSKLNVASRTEAVVIGIRKGIISLEDFENNNQQNK